MKIALLCTGMGNVVRGHEIFGKNLFELLKNDLDITLFKGGGEPGEREITVPNIPRYNPLLNNMHLRVSEKWKDAVKEEKREEVEFFTFTYAALKPLLEGGYDIIHCLEKPVANLIWENRCLFGKTPHIVYSNGGALARKELPKCDFIQEYTAYSLNRGIKAKSFLIPYSVNLSRFNPDITTDFRARHNIPEGALMILSVGKICFWHKRMDYLIREVSKVRDAYLVIVGQESSDSPAIKALGKELMGERALFLQMPNEKLPEAYKASDIFALASLTEAFGIVYIEAMAMGIPVVATNHINTRQILKNQVFVDMKKEGALAKAILALDKDKEKRAIIGKNGQEVAKECYDLRKGKEKYIDMYLQIYKTEPKIAPYTLRDKLINNLKDMLGMGN